jgi:hypothetical protein
MSGREVRARKPAKSKLAVILEIVSPGWLYDRRSVLRLKQQNYQNRQRKELQGLAHRSEVIDLFCQALESGLSPARQKSLQSMVATLDGINRELWEEEDRIRAAATARQICRAAKSIIALNDSRTGEMKTIDQLFGSATESKVYRKGVKP